MTIIPKMAPPDKVASNGFRSRAARPRAASLYLVSRGRDRAGELPAANVDEQGLVRLPVEPSTLRASSAAGA
jgi:hypothetical protein